MYSQLISVRQKYHTFCLRVTEKFLNFFETRKILFFSVKYDVETYSLFQPSADVKTAAVDVNLKTISERT
jgi:hypothetical protein